MVYTYNLSIKEVETGRDPQDLMANHCSLLDEPKGLVRDCLKQQDNRTIQKQDIKWTDNFWGLVTQVDFQFPLTEAQIWISIHTCTYTCSHTNTYYHT